MKVVFANIAAALIVACSGSSEARVVDALPDCTAEARAGIILTTSDSLSGQTIATPAAVTAQDGGYTEKAIAAPPQYFMAFERQGTYAITVQVDGFQPWHVGNVVVQADRCHVVTVRLAARLAR